MLDYNIFENYQEYMNEYKSLYSMEERVCKELNENRDLLTLAKAINSNIPSSYEEEIKTKDLKYFSGASLNKELIIGNMLAIKFLTDNGDFKEFARDYFSDKNLELYTDSFDKKLWELDYTYIAKGIELAKENSNFPYKKEFDKIDTYLKNTLFKEYDPKSPTDNKTAEEFTYEDKRIFWSDQRNKPKIQEFCKKAGVTNWLIDNIFSTQPNARENATRGSSLNVIQDRDTTWLTDALDTNKLLLSGPSGTAARMMLYFLWFHKKLDERSDENITRVLSNILNEDISSKRDSELTIELKNSYKNVIKAILLPPFDHHSIYEIETILEGVS